jgi:hypothetical protein
MGREATCHCKWGAEEADCKVLLEGRELILRTGMRRRVPRTSMMDVAARGGKLVFNVGRDHVELHLGPEAAQRWAKTIAAPLPDLASKLGISPTTKISVLGNVGSEELKAALAEGIAARGKEIDLTLICANTQTEVDHCFAGQTLRGPLWIVYPKGAKSQIKESQVRDLLRSHGFIDTKVASVSTKLTAIRFVKRKSPA